MMITDDKTRQTLPPCLVPSLLLLCCLLLDLELLELLVRTSSSSVISREVVLPANTATI